MKDRREFLKGAATGAVLLGSQGKLALAGMMAPRQEKGKSRVVVARDAGLGAGAPDEKRVLDLLDHAITTYTGRAKPSEAWNSVGFPHIHKNHVVGLKVNGLGGRGISTHAVLIQAMRAAAAGRRERGQHRGVGP